MSKYHQNLTAKHQQTHSSAAQLDTAHRLTPRRHTTYLQLISYSIMLGMSLSLCACGQTGPLFIPTKQAATLPTKTHQTASNPLATPPPSPTNSLQTTTAAHQ